MSRRRRVAAVLIDVLLLAELWCVVSSSVLARAADAAERAEAAHRSGLVPWPVELVPSLVVAVVVAVLYFGTLRGATLGMRALGAVRSRAVGEEG
ncbi:hypothetical protein ACFP1Z_31320 [Streptomyces gamaensis]|uniref:RDD domain-containing protein n=1 Tax=Streptomyces gamaensis TaxID=1763542 RepID=A0ABW0Z940_9ACTN